VQGGAPAQPPAGQAQAQPPPAAAAGARPERSLAGKISSIGADGVTITGPLGRQWHVTPAAGALIRLNGKGSSLGELAAGDTVVVLGQAQPGPGNRFLAHAIAARRK
jgi:hypothetical protein